MSVPFNKLKQAILVSVLHEIEKQTSQTGLEPFSNKIGEATKEFTKGSIKTGKALGGAAKIAFKSLMKKK